MAENKESVKDKLTEKQIRFCIAYASKEFFANGTESYSEAYGIDLTEPGSYNTCKSNAYKLLTNTYILEYINELLDLAGLNDSFVDKQLTFVITQNADMGSKVAAIREYNKLKKRIDNKLSLGLEDGVTEVSINIKKN
jgi:phage terminase small subunit